MAFELTPELVDQVIFGMENQDAEYYVDTRVGVVVSELEITEEADESDTGEQRYIPVPEWRSVDGYNLMEGFVGTLRNPIYRERLRKILASGRGVFRQFKDTVKERKEIERLWFNFKEKEMRRIVVEWFNDMRETAGLDRVELEFEDTEDLVFSDFVVDAATVGELGQVQDLDRAAFDEMYDGEPDAVVAYYRSLSRASAPAVDAEESVILVARTPAEEFAAFLWAVEEAVPGGPRFGRILQIYVTPEYRGLGLARAMLHSYRTSAIEKGIERLLIRVEGESTLFADMLFSEGFALAGQILEVDLAELNAEPGAP